MAEGMQSLDPTCLLTCLQWFLSQGANHLRPGLDLPAAVRLYPLFSLTLSHWPGWQSSIPHTPLGARFLPLTFLQRLTWRWDSWQQGSHFDCRRPWWESEAWCHQPTCTRRYQESVSLWCTPFSMGWGLSPQGYDNRWNALIYGLSTNWTTQVTILNTFLTTCA